MYTFASLFAGSSAAVHSFHTSNNAFGLISARIRLHLALMNVTSAIHGGVEYEVGLVGVTDPQLNL